MPEIEIHGYRSTSSGSNPPKLKFLELETVNRRFLGKRTQTFRVIETIISIATKFCTTIQTSKYSTRVIQIRVQLIQDSGRPPYLKPKNRDIFRDCLGLKVKVIGQDQDQDRVTVIWLCTD